MINKLIIDTMMTYNTLHTSISKPQAQPVMGAYWFEITRGDSNQGRGRYRI